VAIRHHVGLFRRIVGKVRGRYQLMLIDWNLITLPAVTNEHALKNRLDAEQMAAVMPIISDGVIAIEESYDVSANVFGGRHRAVRMSGRISDDFRRA
jgi:hypothetical protein